MVITKSHFGAILLLFFLCCANCFALEISLPQRVPIGQPFLLRIESRKRLVQVKIGWLGKKAQAQGQKVLETPLWRADFILGTDVRKDKAGAKSLYVKVLYPKGSKERKFKVQITPKRYAEQRLRVSKHLVTLSRESLVRVRREGAVVRKLLSAVRTKAQWSFPFQRPVAGPVTGYYGVRRFFNGLPRSPHRGVDFAGKSGTPIRAINNGRVILVSDHFFAGNGVYVDHGSGLISGYFHLRKPLVKKGQEVTKGQVVGLMGATGRSTRAHLHLSLYSLGRAINSLPLFDENGPFFQ